MKKNKVPADAARIDSYILMNDLNTVIVEMDSPVHGTGRVPVKMKHQGENVAAMSHKEILAHTEKTMRSIHWHLRRQGWSSAGSYGQRWYRKEYMLAA